MSKITIAFGKTESANIKKAAAKAGMSEDAFVATAVNNEISMRRHSNIRHLASDDIPVSEMPLYERPQDLPISFAPEIVMDTNGHYWRRYEDGTLSIPPTTTANEQTEVSAIYRPVGKPESSTAPFTPEPRRVTSPMTDADLGIRGL